MEPGGLRESPAGSGASEPGEWSEEVRGGEAEVKTGLEEGDEKEESDFKQKEDTQSLYEEELDPRIKVLTYCCLLCTLAHKPKYYY